MNTAKLESSANRRTNMSPALSDDPQNRESHRVVTIMSDDSQAALIESAKDRLRMATIERKRMTSLNAESRGNRFSKGKFRYHQAAIQEQKVNKSQTLENNSRNNHTISENFADKYQHMMDSKYNRIHLSSLTKNQSILQNSEQKTESKLLSKAGQNQNLSFLQNQS